MDNDQLVNILEDVVEPQVEPKPVVEEKVEKVEKKVEKKPAKKPKPKSDSSDFIASSDIAEHDIDYWKMARHFGFDINDLHLYQQKLDTIIKWAGEEIKSSNLTDIMIKIKSLQRELGSDPIGKPLEEVYRWIVLDREENQIRKEKQLLK